MVRSTQTMHPPCVTSTWASSPSGTIECVQNDFWVYIISSANHAPISHRYYHYLQMERSGIPHDPCQLGVPSGASKMISEPMVHSTQTVHLSCIKISTVSKQTELSLEPRHLGVPSDASKIISKPMVRLAQTITYLAPIVTLSPKRKKWDSTWPTSPKSSIGCVQSIFQAYGTFDANHAPILYHFHLRILM
jgi:hypothetical protein